MTVLIWTQHLLGTGHLRRALALAAALADQAIDTTLVSGGPPARFTPPERIRFVQLDPVHAGSSFSDLRDAENRPWQEPARRRRARALAELVAECRPRVLVTELFPFGRRAFAAELLPVIEAVRRRGGRIVGSVRDVLAKKSDPARSMAMRDLARSHYDRILVHGDPDFLPFAATFPHAAALKDLVTHTGFIVDRPTRPAPRRHGILVSAGGGRVGAGLLQVAARACASGAGGGEPWHLVGGAALTEPDRAGLQAMLGPSGRIDAHLFDLPARLAACRLSISQAGYNTVAEALMGGAPMVLVPFAEAGETEQGCRASRLASLDRAVMLEADGLTSDRLAAAIDLALRQDTRIGQDWAFDGAATSARIIGGLLG